MLEIILIMKYETKFNWTQVITITWVCPFLPCFSACFSSSAAQDPYLNECFLLVCCLRKAS